MTLGLGWIVGDENYCITIDIFAGTTSPENCMSLIRAITCSRMVALILRLRLSSSGMIFQPTRPLRDLRRLRGKLFTRCRVASGAGLEKRAESGGMGVFLSGESGGVQPKGGRGETQESEEVEMDIISSLLSGLLSLVERLVLALVEGLEPLVESWA